MDCYSVGGGLLDITKTDNGDWYSASVNSAGQFGINLPDGNYNIDYFWSYQTGWIELNINFTVQNGVLVETTGYYSTCSLLKATFEDD